MEKEFRIREQYGLFFIERKITYEVNYFGKWSGRLTHSEQRERWDTIADHYNINLENGSSPYMGFATLKEALDYVPKINPIYHLVK